MSWSDMAAQLARGAVAEFGEDATYHPADGGQTVAVRAIYREPHVQYDPVSGATLATKRPAVDLVLADLPDAPQAGKSKVTVRGATWHVSDVQRDGEGVVTLALTARPRAD